MKKTTDYLQETSSKESMIDDLIARYLESLLHQALMENMACEQASRMMSMKSASDNAQKLADKLQLVFNKSRQAAITQEISEIISGSM